METQVKGPMLTPQPDMEISTSQSAVALSGSGIIDPDFGASAAATGEALPPAAAGTQQQTQHVASIHTAAGARHRDACRRRSYTCHTCHTMRSVGHEPISG